MVGRRGARSCVASRVVHFFFLLVCFLLHNIFPTRRAFSSPCSLLPASILPARQRRVSFPARHRYGAAQVSRLPSPPSRISSHCAIATPSSPPSPRPTTLSFQPSPRLCQNRHQLLSTPSLPIFGPPFRNPISLLHAPALYSQQWRSNRECITFNSISSNNISNSNRMMRMFLAQ